MSRFHVRRPDPQDKTEPALREVREPRRFLHVVALAITLEEAQGRRDQAAAGRMAAMAAMVVPGSYASS